MPVPHLLVAVVAVLWLAPGGLAERALGALPDRRLVRDELGLGIVLVYVYKETPFLVLLMLARDGQRACASARRPRPCSARPRASGWRWVVWPTMRGPLVVGSIVVAAFALGAFEVPLAGRAELPADAGDIRLRGRPGRRDRRARDWPPPRCWSTAGAAILLALVAAPLARTVEGD